MAHDKSTNRKNKASEKPISLHPLRINEALGALLATKLPPEKKRRGKRRIHECQNTNELGS